MKNVVLLSFFVLFTSFSFAHDHAGKNMADNVVIERAWARETFKMARTGAAYITMNNPTDKEIQLVAASVDDSVAAMVEIHTSVVVDGMMRMQQLEEGVTVAAGETAEFQPGGMHFMIMGLTGPLLGNEEFALTLTFADESKKTVTVNIQDMRTATE